MNMAKSKVEALLNKLPDNCSLEDIQYHTLCDGKDPPRYREGGKRGDHSAGRGGKTVEQMEAP